VSTGNELVGLMAVGVVLVEGAPGTPQAFTDAERAAVTAAATKATLLLSRLSRTYSPDGRALCRFLLETTSVTIAPGPVPPPTNTLHDKARRDAEIVDRRSRWMPGVRAALGVGFIGEYCENHLQLKDWGVPLKPRRGVVVLVTKFPMGWMAHAGGEGSSTAFVHYDWCVSTGPYLGTGAAGPGLANLDRVIAHEIGHLFGGLDEYLPCVVSETAGPRPTTNANCGGLDRCLMKDNDPVLCPASVEHLGWVDLDGDGIVDATPPSVTGLTPDLGPPGTVVDVDGVHLGDTSTVDLLGIGGADFAVVSDTRLVITIPDGDGVRDVNVTTPLGVTFSGVPFTYT
jgi:hypothetical protein